MKISFYKSLSLFTIRQQLTIVYVIPLNKSKNLKFIWEYDDSFLCMCWMVVIPENKFRISFKNAIFSNKRETSLMDNLT